MWFWLSLIALLCWSGSDLFSKIGCRDARDKYSHLKMVMAVGVVMGLHAAYEVFVGGTVINLDILLTYLPVSLLYILSMAMGYVGLRYIELSISSPICNSSGALVAVLAILFDGIAGYSPLALFAVALVCVGAVGLGVVEVREDDELRIERQKASNYKYTKSFMALAMPAAYCVLDAAGTFADSRVLEIISRTVEDYEASANVAYELTFLLAGILSFVYVVLIKKDRLVPKMEAPKYLGAVCETAGQFAYIYAIADTEHLAMSAPIIASYCAASVLWSRIFLKEKLSWKHYAMIALILDPLIQPGHKEGQQEAADAADRRQHDLPCAHITGGDDDQCGGQHDAEDPVEGDGVVLPEEPAHQPCQQQDRQHHPRQAGGEHQEVQPGQPLQHGLVQPQGHHHRGGGHARDHQAHAPQGAAEVIPPEVGLHSDADHFSYVKQAEKDSGGAHRHADPGAQAPSLLPRLPEEGGDRAHDQADEQPGGNGAGDVDGGGDPLGKAQKADGAPQADGQEPPPVFGDGLPGVGQHLHKGTVDVEHHRQHPAGDPRQDGAGPDQDAAQQVPQPAYAKILIPLPPQRCSSILLGIVDFMIAVLPSGCNPILPLLLKKFPVSTAPDAAL